VNSPLTVNDDYIPITYDYKTKKAATQLRVQLQLYNWG